MTFWMVYGLHQRSPVHRHKSELSAIDEAKRLARQKPDVEFFVLEATHHVVKRDVDVTDIGTGRRWEDDIPF
jgi:hypothetical protein